MIHFLIFAKNVAGQQPLEVSSLAWRSISGRIVLARLAYPFYRVWVSQPGVSRLVEKGLQELEIGKARIDADRKIAHLVDPCFADRARASL